LFLRLDGVISVKGPLRLDREIQPLDGGFDNPPRALRTIEREFW